MKTINNVRYIYVKNEKIKKNKISIKRKQKDIRNYKNYLYITV